MIMIMIIILYSIAILALVISLGAIYLTLIEGFPVKWVYYHYKIRKPFNWAVFIFIMGYTLIDCWNDGVYPKETFIPSLIALIALIITYKLHQEKAFQAVDYPIMSRDYASLPINDEMEIAVIEIDNVIKCYPLDYVIHHHIINDKFKDRVISLTYCAMCRSIIAFDVTEIGPLFVGSFKFANMIVADRKTKTFFQQATFKSIIGKLHPMELKCVPFQILTWKEVKVLHSLPLVAKVTEKDFRDFELPIPGIWKKIVATEATPGLPNKKRDKTFPARTHVIGIYDPSIAEEVVYLKDQVLEQKIMLNEELDFFLIGLNNTVNGFKLVFNNKQLAVKINDNFLVDEKSDMVWDLRGKYISGTINEDLTPILISDEYWFSWIKFHPNSKLMKQK